MYQKIFQIDHLHFKIFYSKDSLLKLICTHQKKDLIDPQISLNITKSSNLKFAKHVKEQLDAYFQRKLKNFDVPYSIEGSSFFKKALSQIEKARRVFNGSANGKNSKETGELETNFRHLGLKILIGITAIALLVTIPILIVALR